MKNCPQCGQERVAETYKCPACEVFYSQLDELLFEEQQRLEAKTFKAHLRRIWAAEDKQQALGDALHICNSKSHSASSTHPSDDCCKQ